MHRLLGYLDGETFARCLGWALLALVAATLSWPFLLAPVVLGMGCSSVGGACGALALVLSLFVKPVFFVAFVALTTFWAIPRLRHAGQAPAFLLAAAVPFVLLPSLTFWTVASAPWSAGFALGYVGGGILDFNVAIACLLGLALVPAADFNEDGARATQPIAPLVWCLIVLAGTVIVGYLLQRTVHSGVIDGRAAQPVTVGISYLNTLILYVKHAFVLSIAWLCYKTHDAGGGRMTLPTLALGVLVSLVAVVQIAISLSFWIAHAGFGVTSRMWLVQLVSYLQFGQFLGLVTLCFLIGGVGATGPASPEKPNATKLPRRAIAARPAGFGRRGTPA